MGDSHVVFDISSDEEKGFDEPEGDDFSWLSKLLCDEVDDSDEVVVVGEIKSKSSKSTVNNEDDDDCVVLDADPDKVVSARNDKAGEGEREGKLQGDGDDDGDGDGEEDDLVVVGERGQIACRDFPHPRHLCAKFPFSSTAHELHCDQCHCYVCDSVAPCAHWDSGVCDIDHCHATEKEEFWKSQRKNFRLKRDAPLPVKVPDTSLCTTFPQLNQIPPRDIIRLSNCVPQNQHSRPGIVRTCSSSNRLNIPNIISQGRSRQSGPVFGKNRLQTRIVSQQSPLLRVRNNVIRRDRGLNGGNLGMFRRPGIAGDASTMNQSVYGSANNTRGVHASEITCAPHPRATSTDGINMRYVPSMSQDSCTYQNLSQTGTGSVFVSTVPSQSPVYSQTIPEPQPYSQPMSQQPIYSQPIPQLPIYSQPIPELQVSSESVPQPHGYVEHISQSNDSLLIGELGNQRQNTAGPNLSDFDPWVNVCGSNQQPPNENCHLHRTGSTNEPLLFQELNSHCNGGTKFHYSDHEFDDVWFQENHAVQVPEAYAPAHFVDAGWAYTLSEDLF